MKKRIYLMRHARTVYNIRHIVQGYANDSDLLEESKFQTKKVAKYFVSHEITFSNVYASNNVRASKTAQYVTDNKYNVIKVDDLREMKFGSDEGKHIHYDFNRLVDVPGGFKSIGGESNIEAANRLYNALKKIIEEPNNIQVLCVSSCAIILNFLKIYDFDYFKTIYGRGSFTNLTTLVLDYENGNFKVVEELIFN